MCMDKYAQESDKDKKNQREYIIILLQYVYDMYIIYVQYMCNIYTIYV